MNPPPGRESPPIRQSVLAGLETGTVGGLCMALYFAAGSLVSGESVWSVSARVAHAAFGASQIPRGGSWAILAGFALLFAGSGTLGIGFGLLARIPWVFRRVLVLGPVAGMASGLLSAEALWGGLRYEIDSIAAGRSLIVAHLLLGLVLSMYPRFLHSLRRAAGPPL